MDILQESISKLTNKLVHQEEENPEEECLTDTIEGEQAQLQLQEELKEEPAEDPPEELQGAPQLCVEYGPWKREEETSPMMTEEGNGKEEGEEPQKLILHLNPINLDPRATAQPQNNPLPVYILPLPAAKPIPKAPTKESNSSLPMLKNFKRLVAIVQNFAHYLKEDGSCSQRMAQWLVRVPVRIWSIRTSTFVSSPTPLFVLIFLVLFYFIVFYFDFVNFSS